jgi:hypothetical protein
VAAVAPVAVAAVAPAAVAAVALEVEVEAEEAVVAQRPVAAAGTDNNRSRRAGKADMVERAHSADKAEKAGTEEMAGWETMTSG